jgi:arylformamidase
MYKFIGSIALAASIITPVASQQARERLSPECRKQVRDLCFSGGVRDREAIRACFKEKASQLSDDCRAELRKRIEGRMGKDRQPPSEGGKEIGYGPDQRQQLDYWPASSKSSPLVVYIHGGGWSRGDKRHGAGSKPAFYNQLGYGFASLNYRLVPQVSPDSQAQDIATAIATLRKDAAQLGFDPSRIIMMGHSAGAHLAALVSTDPRYFQAAAVPMSAIAATVLLDGAGYDVPRQMAESKNLVGPLYEAAFTTDKARQAALSPVTHAAAPNSRNWLILHVESRADARSQSDALATALRRAGAHVEVKAVPGATHMTVNRDAGQEGTFVAREISAFVKAL